MRDRHDQVVTGSGRRQRRVAIDAREDPARLTRVDVEAVEPRSLTVGIGGEIQKSPAIDEYRMA